MTSRRTNVKAALRSRQRGFFLNPYRFNSSGAPGLPIVLSMRCNGVDGGDIFTDDSPAGRTATKLGSARTSTEQSLSGGASLKFPTSGSGVTYPASSDFTLGLADFSIKCSVFPTSYERRYKGLIACDQIGGTRGWLLALSDGVSEGDNEFVFAAYNGLSSCLLRSGFALPLNTWSGIEVRRESGVFKLLINNVLVSTDASKITLSVVNPGTPIVIGSLWSMGGVLADSNTNGYIDEIIIASGIPV